MGPELLEPGDVRQVVSVAVHEGRDDRRAERSEVLVEVQPDVHNSLDSLVLVEDHV